MSILSKLKFRKQDGAATSDLPSQGEPTTDGDEHEKYWLEEDEAQEAQIYFLMAMHQYHRALDQVILTVSAPLDVISLRQSKGHYSSYPSINHDASTWHDQISVLNAEAVIRITSDSVRTFAARLPGGIGEVQIDSHIRIQMLDSLQDLGTCRKNQKAAMIRNEGTLVVWADDVEHLLGDATVLLDKMRVNLWRDRLKSGSRTPQARSVPNLGYVRSSPLPTTPTSPAPRSPDENFASSDGPRLQSPTSLSVAGSLPSTTSNLSGAESPPPTQAIFPESSEKVELGARLDGSGMSVDKRPVMMWAPITTGLAVILAFALVGLGIGHLLSEYAYDGKAIRFALIATLPFTICIASFFVMFLVGLFWQMFGPVSQLHCNSLFYSGVKPSRYPSRLPTFSIVCPVYKESLEAVIRPTVDSLKVAMTCYERQGGSVRILICEDGMQVLDPVEQQKRKDFYDQFDIAWVARPPHGQDGYVRAGRFKKASNMNHALELSMRVEALLEELKREENPPTPGPNAYELALAQALAERDGATWASGNIRIAEYMLLIDCDTRVPSDCFLDAASEMEMSPELAILQHESSVLEIHGDFMERAISFWTRRINHSISWAVANGDVAPFVGHNAFLRWSAMQDVAPVDENGCRKIWSESHVSEDFDLSMRLQLAGYTIRWASYADGFKEGVSLTIVDEISRWEKYAYGVSELVFNRFSQWHRGPISPLVRRYVWSDIPLHSKLSILSYCFSYYAIASGLTLSVLNWALEGIFLGNLDLFYVDSWEVFITIWFVFIGAGNLSSAIREYRCQHQGLTDALWEHAKWIPFFFIFFSGLSWHLSVAILAHLTGYNIVWEGTIKTVQVSNFFLELPAIWKRFWPVYLVCFAIIAAMVIMTTDLVPLGYRIDKLIDIVPLAVIVGGHMLAPILLNPWLMHFHF